jgi:small basic protein
VIPALALVVGVALGLFLEPTVPPALQPYLPIAVVAALDAVFGAVRAQLDGIFDDRVFVVSFVSNVVVAGLVVFLGDQLGVGGQLSTGVVVVLGSGSSPTRRPSAGTCSTHEPRRAGSPATRPRAGLPRAGPCACTGPRLRRVDVLVALLLAVLGFAAAVQVRTTQTEGPLAYARQEDLVTILDDLSNRTSACAARSAASTRRSGG